MLHPKTELKIVNAVVGYGVFATEVIPKGTITWALDPLDQILEPERTGEIEAQFHGSVEHFTWTNGRGKRILCWDFGRYMNHSCSANSIGYGGAEFEIAVRDIARGEELTSDYRTLNLESAMACTCGAASCTGMVRASDLDAIAGGCDQAIQSAFAMLHQVEQPLWQWLDNKSLVRRLANAPAQIPSVLKHRWPQAEASFAVSRSI